MTVVSVDKLEGMSPGAFLRERRTLRAEKTLVVIVLAALIFQPILHPSGPANSSPVDVFILASIVAFVVWARRTHEKLRAPYFIPVALMVVAGAASGLVSIFPSLSLSALVTDLVLFAWCTVLVNILRRKEVLRWALAAWAWSGIGWAALVVVAWLGHISALEGLQAAEGNRVLFTFGDPNYAATYWLSTIFIVYSSQVPCSRRLRVAGYVLLLWALALTESNGGVLALAIGVAFILLVKAYHREGFVGVTKVSLVIGISIGAFFTAFPLQTLRHDALYSGQPLLVNSLGRSAQSTSERSELIVEMDHLFDQSSGVLGIGLDSTKPVLASEMAVYPNEAHDDFLAALVERGPLGFLGLVLLIGAAILWAGPIVRSRERQGLLEVVPIPYGIVASLLALSVNAFYEEILHFRFLWILLALVAVLGREARR
ncbi:MAG: O-antigen ligase family protein [Acidimicrobiales bacterium]